MKIIVKRICIILLMAAVVTVYVRCRQPYVLPVSVANSNYLVVEGVIDNNPVIKLSRTVRLNDTVSSKAEPGAKISIETEMPGGSGTATTALTDNGGGSYSLTGSLTLDPDLNYRIKIVTSNGEVYTSDFVPVKNSPPVDSLNYEITPTGVQIYSATHDPSNKTRYYRWDFTETWLIHSKFASLKEALTSPKDTIINRPSTDQIFTCWTSDASTSIVLNSSAKLSQDVIVHNALAFVASSSEKLGLEYSIGVNQYALTTDAYNYWQNLKKNTEQLGSIFDAQPSEITGNIHSVSNPAEPVVGYISAGSPAQARIFIGASILPEQWFRTIPLPYANCNLDSLYFKDPKRNNTNSTLLLYPGGETPIEGLVNGQMVLIGYTASSSFCVDCRLRGTNVRPSFWVDKF